MGAAIIITAALVAVAFFVLMGWLTVRLVSKDAPDGTPHPVKPPSGTLPRASGFGQFGGGSLL